MNYQQTIDFLFSRLPIYSRVGAIAYKGNLDNIIAICQFLDNPEKKFKSIHVAGTNGKGSVSHMLAAILQTAGYKTGLHTSPHLTDFRERIKMNGEMVPRQFVIDFTERVLPIIEKINPSFFELSVAMAFEYFAAQQVDIAIIETGLGGRLDSTNILLPELSVITNISKDHLNLLGDTLEKIAAEKAGIIKPGIPVVIGESAATDSVFVNDAAKKQAPLTIASQQWQVANWQWEKHFLQVEISSMHHTDHQKYQLDLAGIYQVKNLLAVLEACRRLRSKGWLIADEHIGKALMQVKKLTGLHGRWEWIGTTPDTIIDVAHNEAGIKQVLEQVELAAYHALHIVIGMVNDKEIETVLKLLPPTAHYYFTQAHIPRALDAALLAEKAGTLGLNGNTYPDVNTAIREARVKAGPKDLVLVCGSIFLVAEVNR